MVITLLLPSSLLQWMHYRFLNSCVSPVRANIMSYYCSFFRNTTETQDMDFANALLQILIWVVYYLFIYSNRWDLMKSQCVLCTFLCDGDDGLTPCCEWHSQIIWPWPMIPAHVCVGWWCQRNKHLPEAELSWGAHLFQEYPKP